jgi:hypothetical protein
LGAFANLVGAHRHRPPRLILLLGGFFVLTVGGIGIRHVPTVALAIALGVIATERWAKGTRKPQA